MRTSKPTWGQDSGRTLTNRSDVQLGRNSDRWPSRMATSSSRSSRELAHYSGVRENEQVMVAQIKRAACETSKNTIYAADGNLPVLYDDWKGSSTPDRLQLAPQASGRYGTIGTNAKRTSTKRTSVDKCTDTEDVIGNHLRRARSTHGYQRSNRDNEVLPMRKARSLQKRLPKQAKNQGRAPPSSKHLLGQTTNGRSNGDSRGGKRGCREVTDSTYSAKDLVSSGTQIAHEDCTYMLVVTTAHSNIPATSQSDQELSKNHTGSQEPAVVRLPTGPSTSNSLRAKANGKLPTIATPSIMALHQSRPPMMEFQAAVTNERPVGTGEALSVLPAFTALRSPCLAGSFEGIASVKTVDLAVKPPLGKEITIWLPKCKSPVPSQGALGPKPDDAAIRKIKDEPESSKCPQLVANACRDAGRLDDGGTLNETRNLSTRRTGLKDQVKVTSCRTVRSLRQSLDQQCQLNLSPLYRVIPSRKRTSHSTTDLKAAGQEAASAQAVNRGRKVSMSEVQDQDDNTSFMMNMRVN